MNAVLRTRFPKDIVCMIEAEVNAMYQREWFKRMVNVNIEYHRIYELNRTHILATKSRPHWRYNFRCLHLWGYGGLPIWNVKYLRASNAFLPKHY